jgi:CO dehydrogenase maturation factor
MKKRVIAVCGKGGVGKTTVSALLVKLLSEPPREARVLAVDADHAGGLSMTLGLGAKTTLNDIRLAATERLRTGRTSKRTVAQTLDYLLLDALVEQGTLAFLAAGRPEEPGCFCALNSLLRESIATLGAQFDVTVVDAEAGVEQVNRDVIASVTDLLLVTDTSARGLRVAETIRDVACQSEPAPATHLLLNRVRGEEEVDAVRSRTELPLIGWLPDDDVIRRFDAEELSYLELPSCAASQALEPILELFQERRSV